MSDLVSRYGTLIALNESGLCYNNWHDVRNVIKSIPSADAVDCTEFILWLLDEIMDEENWEWNAVAYGEIIARKLKKLGLLEVRDGYYVRTPSADAAQGEWEDKEIFNDTNDDHIVDKWQSARCSVCGWYHTTPFIYYFNNFNFCPNCGAKMKGAEHEID